MRLPLLIHSQGEYAADHSFSGESAAANSFSSEVAAAHLFSGEFAADRSLFVNKSLTLIISLR